MQRETGLREQIRPSRRFRVGRRVRAVRRQFVGRAATARDRFARVKQRGSRRVEKRAKIRCFCFFFSCPHALGYNNILCRESGKRRENVKTVYF